MLYGHGKPEEKKDSVQMEIIKGSKIRAFYQVNVEFIKNFLVGDGCGHIIIIMVKKFPALIRQIGI